MFVHKVVVFLVGTGGRKWVNSLVSNLPTLRAVSHTRTSFYWMTISFNPSRLVSSLKPSMVHELGFKWATLFKMPPFSVYITSSKECVSILYRSLKPFLLYSYNLYFLSPSLTDTNCTILSFIHYLMGHLLFPNWFYVAKQKRFTKVSPE